MVISNFRSLNLVEIRPLGALVVHFRRQSALSTGLEESDTQRILSRGSTGVRAGGVGVGVGVGFGHADERNVRPGGGRAWNSHFAFSSL